MMGWAGWGKMVLPRRKHRFNKVSESPLTFYVCKRLQIVVRGGHRVNEFKQNDEQWALVERRLRALPTMLLVN